MRDLRACLIGGLAAAAIITAAACSNDLAAPSAPSNNAPRAITPSELPFFSRADKTGGGGNGGGGGGGSSSGTVTVTFTIDPFHVNYVVIGPHLLVIPAGEVCDPATSGYGVLTWNLPCNSVQHPITVTATATTVGSHPVVTFNTHLRFKPVRDDHDAVWLFLTDQNGSNKSKIFWCPDGSSSCVDESLLAPSMQTHWDNHVTVVYRRILHFSGYNVTGGRSDSDF